MTAVVTQWLLLSLCLYAHVSVQIPGTVWIVKKCCIFQCKSCVPYQCWVRCLGSHWSAKVTNIDIDKACESSCAAMHQIMSDGWFMRNKPSLCAASMLSVKYSVVRVICHVNTDKSLWVCVCVCWHICLSVCLRSSQGSLCRMSDAQAHTLSSETDAAMMRTVHLFHTTISTCVHGVVEGVVSMQNAQWCIKKCLSESPAPVHWVRLSMSVCMPFWCYCLSVGQPERFVWD